ncbi:MAG: hypothetical protein QXT45_07800 [Candidatus Bilamarchaeaceae archaeon]
MSNHFDASVQALKRQVNELKQAVQEKDERDLLLMQDLSQTHRDLQERVLVLETSYDHIAKLLLHLQKELSIQTRISLGLLTAVVSALTGYAIKIVFNL